MKNSWLTQSPYRCRLDWGAAGAQRASTQGNIIVIVDVLSFSTSVAHAVSRGAVIYPCPENEDTGPLAKKLDAEIAVPRARVPHDGRFSLSPMTYTDIEKETKVILPSLNGGTCVSCSQLASHVFVGALVNASAVGQAVTGLMADPNLNTGIIACGEREKEPPHDLRPAVEDYLGAGAILSHIPFDKSPEAMVCESAFKTNEGRVKELIWNSVSGRELRAIRFEADVEFAARRSVLNAVPYLDQGRIVNFCGM